MTKDDWAMLSNIVQFRRMLENPEHAATIEFFERRNAIAEAALASTRKMSIDCDRSFDDRATRSSCSLTPQEKANDEQTNDRRET